MTTDTKTMDLNTIRKMIMQYLDERGARHAMVGYPYTIAAAEYLILHPEARARRQLRDALAYVETRDQGGRTRKAIDRCIRTMIVQMNEEITVKELIFSVVDHVCLEMANGELDLISGGNLRYES